MRPCRAGNPAVATVRRMLFPVRFSIFRCVVRRRSVVHGSRINRRLFEQRLGVLLNLQRKVRACGPCATHDTTASATPANRGRERLRRSRLMLCRCWSRVGLLLRFAGFIRIVCEALFFCSGHNAPRDMLQPYRLFPAPHSGHTALSPRPRTIRAHTGQYIQKSSCATADTGARIGHHSRIARGSTPSNA